MVYLHLLVPTQLLLLLSLVRYYRAHNKSVDLSNFEILVLSLSLLIFMVWIGSIYSKVDLHLNGIIRLPGYILDLKSYL